MRRIHRILSCGLVLVSTLLSPGRAYADAAHAYQPGPALREEAKSQDLCESVPNRIFVSTTLGSECVAYFVTKGYEDRPDGVFFINGDSPGFADAADYEAHMRKLRQHMNTTMQKMADQMHVRFIDVVRLGLGGSSGNHRQRMNKRETMILGATIALLKQRLGIDTVALAGQSRGSIISASLLSLGLKGVKCAALGAGALELVNFEYAARSKSHHPMTRAEIAKVVYDPYAHVNAVPQDPNRRVFVLDDPQDQISSFHDELEYTQALKSAGHRALAIQTQARDPEHHGAAAYALRTAGACLNNASDDLIVQAVAAMESERRGASGTNTVAEIAQLLAAPLVDDDAASR
jgi:pimeloyl-ACP methyl ester carboxylesterase